MPQEADVRLAEARQQLEVQQAEVAATAAAVRSSLVQTTSFIPPPPAPQQQQQQMPPPAPISEASDGAMSLSAPVTLNDRQHRTAAALLASLGQTAARGRERLGRLERVLSTIAADAAEPHKVRVCRGVGWSGG